MKKKVYPLLALLCLPVMAFSGCASKTAYILSDEKTGESSSPEIVQREELGEANVGNAQTINDTQKPVILVRGNYSAPINASSKYLSLPKVTVKDDYDPNPNMTVTGKDPDGKVAKIEGSRFYITKLGTYTFTYKAIDASGNSANPVSVSVKVQDDLAPIIDLRSYAVNQEDGKQDGVSCYRYNTVKLPSILVYDYYDYDLEIKVGKNGTPESEYQSVDRYELTFRPMENGEYTILYQAREKGGNGYSARATIPMTVTELSQMNSFEDEEAIAWSAGGGKGRQPTYALSTKEGTFTEGKSSMKVTVFGAEGQVTTPQIYKTDNYGNTLETPMEFSSGWAIYKAFYASGTGDISGYDYVLIDVYNANTEDAKVIAWAKTWTGSVKMNPEIIPAGEWKTLWVPIAKLDNPTNMESLLIVFEAKEQGEYTYYLDNWRVGNSMEEASV